MNTIIFKAVLICLLGILVESSYSQIFVKSFDFKGEEKEYKFDSIVLEPTEKIFNEILPKLSIPKINTYYLEGTIFSSHIIYQSKIIDDNIIRGIGMKEQETKLLLLQKQIMKRLLDYLILEEDRFYIIHIPIKIIGYSDSTLNDSIFIGQNKKWGLKRIITIKKKKKFPN